MESKINYESAIKNIRSELKTYLVDSNLKSVVLGVSGGIDSTLCALLAQPVCHDLNIPLIGRSLPSSSNSEGENTRAMVIGDLFCDNFKEVNISRQTDSLIHLVDEPYHNQDESWRLYAEERAIQNGNVKARVRMIYLYDLASINQGVVLSTDNWTEYLLGFWTLHGDVGDYGMVQSLWKTEVYEMSDWIVKNELTSDFVKEAVQEVINADATDGLGISKSDMDQIMPGWKGSSRAGYAEVDKILMKAVDLVKFPKSLAKRYPESHPVIDRH